LFILAAMTPDVTSLLSFNVVLVLVVAVDVISGG